MQTAALKTHPERSSYILRAGDEAAARLRVLGKATWPTTRELLHRAGIRSGMSVLDVGCGSGEVSLQLASLVGVTGRVLGIDMNAAILARARERARQMGIKVSFRRNDVLAEASRDAFDAVYARFLLSHVTSPETVLERMVAAARPGGVIVVEDVDFAGHFCHPPCSAFDRYLALYQACARARGADPGIGPRLPGLLRAAGLTDVQVAVAQPAFLSGEGKQLAQLTLESIRDTVVSEGLASDAEVDALLAELDAFRRDPSTLESASRIVQAWGRRPAS